MQVTVKDNYLNMRTGLPSVNAPNTKYLNPGDILEIDGQLYQGDSYQGVNTWVKDAAMNYYWSGAVAHQIQTMSIVPTSPTDINDFRQIAQFPPQLINYNERLVKIPIGIKSNLGAGVKVGVLDSGVEKLHLDLAKNLVYSKDFTNSSAGDEDMQGHGTPMASLIAASPFFTGQGVMGVAPDAKLYSAKVMYDRDSPDDFLSVQNGLDDLLTNRMDIINMSIGHPPFNPATVVSQYISNKLAQSTDTIFFASTKQFDQIDNPAELLELFPANCANVIPVCCLTRDLTMKYWDNLPAPLIIVPYFLDSSCSIKTRHYYFQVYGSSVSTALVSGITSLLLSADNTITRTKQGVLNALKPYSSTVEEAFSNPGPEIHFIIKT